MPKNKPHKGMLKRVRITRTGKLRHRKAGSKHLRSHKSPTRLRRLRTDSFMSTAEVRRLSKLLFRRLRGKEQPRSAIRRSPTPAESKAKRDAAKAQAAGIKPAAAPRRTGWAKSLAPSVSANSPARLAMNKPAATGAKGGSSKSASAKPAANTSKSKSKSVAKA